MKNLNDCKNVRMVQLFLFLYIFSPNNTVESDINRLKLPTARSQKRQHLFSRENKKSAFSNEENKKRN